MNYSHYHHFGNHGDILKHSCLSVVLDYLSEITSEFAIFDIHAGSGVYEFGNDEKTAPRNKALSKLALHDLVNATSYSDLVREYGLRQCYPGSPSIIASKLRDQDYLVACELNIDCASQLQLLFASNSQIKIINADGYAALLNLLPPLKKKGLVLLDPPYLNDMDLDHVNASMSSITSMWQDAIVAAWYPIEKNSTGIPKPSICSSSWAYCELQQMKIRGSRGLLGSGMLFLNAPPDLVERLSKLVIELARVLTNSNERWSSKIFADAKTEWELDIKKVA